MGFLLRPIIEKLTPVRLMLLLALCFVLLFRFYPLSTTRQYGMVLMANGSYGNPLIFFGNGSIGAILVLCLSRLLSLTPVSGFFVMIGKRTMGILLVHKPIIDFMNLILEKMGQDVSSIGAIFVNTIVTLILSLILALIIERIIPEILGCERRLTTKAEIV